MAEQNEKKEYYKKYYNENKEAFKKIKPDI